ncbi:nuclear protein Es2-domain-containing protein, partial [Cunninghamella echinulata]
MTSPVVLDEDTYTEAISFIIERDFFPHLAKLKAENTYHEAQINGDFQQLQEATILLEKINRKQTNTEDKKEVKIQNYYNESEVDLSKRINLDLSLDQFQTVYTSEDNASFSDLLEKANARRKNQYRWFYDNQSQRLCIEDKKTNTIESSKTSLGKNLLMYYPEGPSQSSLNDKDSRAAPKSISHGNTMLSSVLSWDQLCGDQNITTPSFRGFGLVESTPIINPSSMDSPLMTWGTIEGTPIQIKGSETPLGRQFSLPKESQREKLGMKLSEKASKAYRKRTNESRLNIKGTPRTGSGMMSPAAQHLLRKSSTPYTKGFDMALRSSYGGSSTSETNIQTPRIIGTPTPLFRSGSTASRLRSNITPKPRQFNTPNLQ